MTRRLATPAWLLRPEFLLVVVLLAMIPVLGERALRQDVDGDEMEAIHSAWLVLQGLQPYSEFFQHHHPFLYYLLAPVIAFFGEGIEAVLAARAIAAAMFVGILWTTYAIGRRLAGPWVGFAATALLATSRVVMESGVEVRPDGPQTLFGLLAVLFFVRGADTRRLTDYALAGATLGVSFLFLQKAMFPMVALGAAAGLRVLTGRSTWKELGVGTAALAAVLVPYYGYVAASGSWEAYFVTNWRVNTASEGGFGPTQHLVESFRYAPLLWIPFVLGLPWFARRADLRELALLALVLLGSLYLYKRPHHHYVLPLFPVMAVLAAAALKNAFEGREGLAAAAVALGAMPGLYHFHFVGFPTNDHKLQMIEHALVVTPEDARVHDGDRIFNLFRHDLDYFWFSIHPGGCLERYQRLEGYDYDVLDLIDEYRPRVINTRQLDAADPRVAMMYERSRVDPRLWVRMRELSFGATMLDRPLLARAAEVRPERDQASEASLPNAQHATDGTTQ